MTSICGHPGPRPTARAVPGQATQVPVPAADAVPDLSQSHALADNAVLGSRSAPVPAMEAEAMSVFSLLLEDGELFASPEMVE